jgi:hypothetical protein
MDLAPHDRRIDFSGAAPEGLLQSEVACLCEYLADAAESIRMRRSSDHGPHAVASSLHSAMSTANISGHSIKKGERVGIRDGA